MKDRHGIIRPVAVALLVSGGVGILSIQATMAQDVHVAADGSDLNPGTAMRPVATLEKARDLLRARPFKARGAVVHVRSGIYPRTEPFRLSEADSGVADGRITYRADGVVRLVGGRMVPARAFRPVSDPAVKARLPEAARERVFELDLANLGIQNTGPFPDLFRDGGGIVELFVNGRRLPLARWPNDGYTTIKRVLDSGTWSGDNRRGGTFEYRDPRPAQWRNAVSDGLWLKGFWRVPWQPETVRVAAIDPDAGTITQAHEVGGGLHIDDRGVQRGYNQDNRHLMAGLKAVDYQSPPWATRYPELVDILNDDPAYPKGNTLINNVLIGCGVHLKGGVDHFKESTIANNPVKSRRDAGLPETGNPIPALRKRETITFSDVAGFEPIPIGNMGLYKDEFRTSLPEVE